MTVPSVPIGIPTPSPLWGLLMQLWAIPAPLALRWHQALYAAQWSEAVAWRRELAVYETVGSASELAFTLCAPWTVLHLVGLLERERRLSHADTLVIEETVLGLIDAKGDWK